MSDDSAIAAEIVGQLQRRDADASICPSEVARALFGPDGREAMPAVRVVAQRLAGEGRVRATQGDVALPTDAIISARGPIRLRRGPAF